MHDTVSIRSVNIESDSFDQSEFRDAVEILRQGSDISGSIFFGDEVSAGSGDICQAFGFA